LSPRNPDSKRYLERSIGEGKKAQKVSQQFASHVDKYQESATNEIFSGVPKI